MSRVLKLTRLQLRRERWLLPIWLIGIVGLLAAAGGAIAREFSGEEERFAIAALAAGNPAFLFLRGLPDGHDVGALVFFQTFAFLAVIIALMNTFLIVRHTRADEERGRSELLLASPIPRTSELRVALGIAAGADALAAVALAAVGFMLGFGAVPSLLLGLALGAVGIAFAGVAALVAQIMPSPRGANGAAAGAVGISYVVRGIGDALGTATDTTHVAPSWISSLSPIGWAQATAPFSTATPLPLLWLVALGIAAGGAAIAIRARRDLGASLVPERLGHARWRRAGAGALAVRLQRGTVIGWSVGVVLLGGLAGTLAPAVANAVESNDALTELIENLIPGLHTDTQTLFTIALLGIAGALATAAGVNAAMRLRAEEGEGRAEELLSTRLSRLPWMGRQVLVAFGVTVVVSTAAATAAGTGLAIAGGGWPVFAQAFQMIAVQLPAGSVFVAIAFLAFAIVPRVTIAIGWGAFIAGLVIAQMGELLGLPEWVQDLSPFHHVPAFPLEPVEPIDMLVPLAVTAALLGAAAVGLRRRDIVA
jgi:ABC-2 type transport system permease protein